MSYGTKRKATAFSLVGETEDGKSVIKGMFKMYSSSLGLSLDIIMGFLWEKGSVIDWFDFYTDARTSGMKHDNVCRLMRGGFIDSMYHGGEDARERLEDFINRLEESSR